MISSDQINTDFQVLELDHRANNYLKEIIEQYSLPTDPYFATVKEKILSTDCEVFYFLTNEDSSLDKIRSVLKISDGAHPPLFAVCTTFAESLSNGGKLSEDNIKSIVDNINSI